MIINLDPNKEIKDKLAIAIGTFDGIHLGHRFLIEKLLQICKEKNYSSMIYTYIQHPLHQLGIDSPPALIMSINNKVHKFHNMGIDFLTLQSFSKEFAQTSPENFFSDICSKFNVRHIVIGQDFKFGHKGLGSVQLLQKLANANNIEVTVVPPYCKGNTVVSSSMIRDLISDGNVEKANEFLGYEYYLYGEVITGFQRGTAMGFPTANLSFNKLMAIPAHGVYMTYAYIEGKFYWGATSIGTNPTFDDCSTHIETHFIDYKKELYGKKIKIFFLQKLRDQIRFDSIEELKKQIHADVEQIKFLVFKPTNMC